MQCVYVQSQDRVTCGPVSCVTAKTSWPWQDKLPVGTYRIGPNEPRGGNNWHKLYPYAGGFFWDYHSKVARLGCRAGFALHGGAGSAGCATATDAACMQNITKFIEERATSLFAVEECLNCLPPFKIPVIPGIPYKCTGGIQEVRERRRYMVGINLVSQS